MILTPQTDRVVLRRDTSSGVRYFDGDRMVSGETGWVDADDYLPWLTREGTSTPRIRMRRVNGNVELDIRAAYVGEQLRADMPIGWRPLVAYSWIGLLMESQNMGKLDIGNLNEPNSVNPFRVPQLDDGASLRGYLRFPAAGWPAIAPPPSSS